MPHPRGSRIPRFVLLATFVVFGGLLGSVRPVGAVAPAPEPEFRRHLDRLVESGELTIEDSYLHRVQRIFAPGDLPAGLRSPEAWPAKSATRLLHDLSTDRPRLDPRIAHVIDGLVEPASSSAAAFAHTTPHFVIEYSLSGADAIPADDIDPANGLPDLVDWVALDAERAWSVFFEGAGFAPPIVSDGRVIVGFREMEAYGYTRLEDGVPRITLHRDFSGFPENLDPAGSRRGAAKVTIAHELKHASQWATSRWTEGGWLEADATWAEDFAFDEVDDYLRYLPHGSPISHPGDWLPASYDDCLWPQLLEQSIGVDVLVEFFEHRAAHPAENVLTSYDRALRSRGSSLAEAAASLGVWCHLSGANADGRPEGFAEAELYPTPPLQDVLVDPEQTVSRSLPGLGTHQVLVMGVDREGKPRIEFVGAGHHNWAVCAVILDEAGSRHVEVIPLSSAAAVSHEIGTTWEETSRLHLIMTRVDIETGDGSYTLMADDRNAVGVGDAALQARFRLEPNRPNPFRSATTISFDLPAESRVRLAVYDVRGRIVRRLVDGETLPAGRHNVSWGGLEEGGRISAPGVYYYRLEAGSDSATRRMLLLR